MSAKKSRKMSDVEIESYLTQNGVSLENYYLERGVKDFLICFVGNNGREYDLIIEDDMKLADCVDYLLEMNSFVETNNNLKM